MNRNLMGFFLFLLYIPFTDAATVFYPPPDNPSKNEKYLFYLHGISVELHGPDKYSEALGKKYRYTAIVNEFLRRGFNVVSEARKPGVRPLHYAIKTADQINTLLRKGVPGKNIAVVGHSRGAFMALMIRPRVIDPKVSIVAMAGCALRGTTSIAGGNPRRAYQVFLNNKAAEMYGRFLSIYDRDDEWFGSCREAFNRANSLEPKEIVLRTRQGHAVFLDPNPAWVEPVIRWIGW